VRPAAEPAVGGLCKDEAGDAAANVPVVGEAHLMRTW
jgi:hypothetical protein